MACDAFHLWNHISLNLDRLRDAIDLDPAEFTADEDINRPEKGGKGSEGAQEENQENQEDRIGPLTLSPTPNLTDHELLEIDTSASDDQAQLMHWHCGLGHLSFDKLKRLARNGEILKKLAKKHCCNAPSASSVQ